MTPERAIELFKWGKHYAKPRMKNEAEYREALDYIEKHPELHTKELQWTTPPPPSTGTHTSRR